MSYPEVFLWATLTVVYLCVWGALLSRNQGQTSALGSSITSSSRLEHTPEYRSQKFSRNNHEEAIEGDFSLILAARGVMSQHKRWHETAASLSKKCGYFAALLHETQTRFDLSHLSFLIHDQAGIIKFKDSLSTGRGCQLSWGSCWSPWQSWFRGSG